MPDVKRCGAILIALSGLMALAQEGQGAEDAVEKDLCTNLTTAIAPVASAFQALVPQDQQPTATLRELVQLSEVVVEVTGAKTGQAGAVRALAKNAAASQLLSERAQVGAICDEMVRDGQISPEERVAYAGYSLADIQQAQRLTVKRPLRQQPVDASGAINGTERPEKREQAARDRAWKAIGRTPPETQSTGGAQ